MAKNREPAIAPIPWVEEEWNEEDELGLEKARSIPAPYRDKDGNPSWSGLSPAEAYAWRATGLLAGRTPEFSDFQRHQEAVNRFNEKANELHARLCKSPVDFFLHVLAGLRDVIGKREDEYRKTTIQLWGWLKEADLIEIPSALHEEVGRYGDMVVRAAQEADRSAGEDQYEGPRTKEIEVMGMPNPPFPCFFLLIWPQVAQVLQEADHQTTFLVQVGYLVRGPSVVRVELVMHLDDEGLPQGYRIEHEEVYDRLGEVRWNGLDHAIMLNLMVGWINDHREYIEDRRPFEYRKKMKASGFYTKSPPPPYYTVLMRDDLVTKTLEDTRRRMFKYEIDWQHRWSVRGHEACIVRRGELPLNTKTRKDLESRRYKIYVDQGPDVESEDYKRLLVRGLEPKAAQEWLAILTVWREAHIKGPEDKPFIPSVRRSARKRQHTIRLRTGSD